VPLTIDRAVVGVIRVEVGALVEWQMRMIVQGRAHRRSRARVVAGRGEASGGVNWLRTSERLLQESLLRILQLVKISHHLVQTDTLNVRHVHPPSTLANDATRASRLNCQAYFRPMLLRPSSLRRFEVIHVLVHRLEDLTARLSQLQLRSRDFR